MTQILDTPTAAGQDQDQSSKLGMALPLLVDLVAPVALFYLLRAFGVSDVLALSLGGLVPAVRIVYGVVRNRTVDKLAAFVLVLAVAGIVASLLSQNAKLVLARESVFTGLAGLWCLLTLIGGKPLTYFSVRPFVTRGNKKRERLWESSWDDNSTFRGIIRLLAVAWGVMFLLDSVARLFVVYALKIDQAAFAVQLPGIALFLVVLIITRRSGSRLRTILDA